MWWRCNPHAYKPINICLVISHIDHSQEKRSNNMMEAAKRADTDRNKKEASIRMPSNQKVQWRNPFSPFLCKVFIVSFLFMETAMAYGTFTDGLPDKFNYESVLAASHLFCTQLQYVFGTVVGLMILFQTSYTRLANSLHKNPPFSMIVFMLIIKNIVKIGIYHSPNY